jgi:hypothetical protein
MGPDHTTRFFEIRQPSEYSCTERRLRTRRPARAHQRQVEAKILETTGPLLEPILSFGTPVLRVALCYLETAMNANRQPGTNLKNIEPRSRFAASQPLGAGASASLQIRASRITSHKSRIRPFLIDTAAIRNRPNSFAFSTNVISNRHSQRPFPFCTIGTKLAKVLYSLPDLLCYSRRRTRVPPPGLRALAPARPTWGESLPRFAVMESFVFPPVRNLPRKHQS